MWPCVGRDHGTTGHWCPCGAHQPGITLNYHDHNERITGLQHCYSLVTTLLQPRDNMPVFRSSHAERDIVTPCHAPICTSGQQMETGVIASGRRVNHLWNSGGRVMGCVCANIQHGFQHGQRVMMWCGGCGKYLYWIN